jgi:serine palmitoyltransferase
MGVKVEREGCQVFLSVNLFRHFSFSFLFHQSLLLLFFPFVFSYLTWVERHAPKRTMGSVSMAILLFLSSVAEAFQEEIRTNPIHLLLELVFILLVIFLFTRRTYVQTRRVQLTEKEIDEICEEWEPESLLTPPRQTIVENMEKKDGDLIVDGFDAGYVYVLKDATQTEGEEEREKLLDLATFNFLGFVGEPEIVDACERTIRKYGCGTCGPRGFYGTFDVHLALEDRIQRFFGTEACILYSYGFATVASAVPAFAKRGDFLIVDEAISKAIQAGVAISRSKTNMFKHNDVKDLEEHMIAFNKKDHEKGTVTRKFVVIEGLYLNRGDIAPLKEIVALCRKHQYRLMMDDTMGIGVLGERGRGTCEHCGVDPMEVDILTGALDAAMASMGGFCVGGEHACDHQRLSGSGYCFSASQPPYLATAAHKAFDQIDLDYSIVSKLRRNSLFVDKELRGLHPKVKIGGEDLSPLKHITLLSSDLTDYYAIECVLQEIVDAMREKHQVAMVVAKYSKDTEMSTVAPSIRLSLCAKHDEKELHIACDGLKEEVRRILASHPEL